MRIVKNLVSNSSGRIDCFIFINEEWHPHVMRAESEYSIHEESEWGGVKECPKEEVDSYQLESLKNSAVAAMASVVIAECKSGTGKLYFSDLNSAARHANELIQPDAEIRARAIQLLSWDVAIDAYALEVVFSIEQGGEVPTLESFIAGLPKL